MMMDGAMLDSDYEVCNQSVGDDQRNHSRSDARLGTLERLMHPFTCQLLYLSPRFGALARLFRSITIPDMAKKRDGH